MKSVIFAILMFIFSIPLVVYGESESEVINNKAWLKVQTVENNYRYLSANEGTKFWIHNNVLYATDYFNVYLLENDNVTYTYEMYDKQIPLTNNETKILTGNTDVFTSPSLVVIYWDSPLDTTYVAQPEPVIVEIPVEDDMESILQTKLLKSIASLITIAIALQMFIFFLRRSK